MGVDRGSVNCLFKNWKDGCLSKGIDNYGAGVETVSRQVWPSSSS